MVTIVKLTTIKNFKSDTFSKQPTLTTNKPHKMGSSVQCPIAADQTSPYWKPAGREVEVAAVSAVTMPRL